MNNNNKTTASALMLMHIHKSNSLMKLTGLGATNAGGKESKSNTSSTVVCSKSSMSTDGSVCLRFCFKRNETKIEF